MITTIDMMVLTHCEAVALGSVQAVNGYMSPVPGTKGSVIAGPRQSMVEGVAFAKAVNGAMKDGMICAVVPMAELLIDVLIALTCV
jgi:hypothetical protein